MKRFATIACLSVALLAPAFAAEAPPTPEQQQLQAAINEVKAQQALLTENQGKIEAKLAAVAEAVRVAKIYSSRSGH